MKAVKTLFRFALVIAFGAGVAWFAVDTWKQALGLEPGQHPLLPIPAWMQALLWTALALWLAVVLPVQEVRRTRRKAATAEQTGRDDDTDGDEFDDARQPVGSGRGRR